MAINEKRIFRYFKELASIPSPSWNEKEVIRYIEAFAKKRSLKLKKFSCRNSHNLLLTLPASGKSGVEPLMFAAHMDTVVPCEGITVLEDEKRFFTDGTTILGGDDKAALAAFLEAVDQIIEKKLPHGELEFLFTCAEEVGLCGMKEFDVKNLSSRRSYVFDSDGNVGSATVRAPFQLTMKVSITGKAAHAGMHPEKGHSAIYAAADIINAMPQGRIDEETTTNVGKISGGKANNIVAEHAEFDLECRSLNRKKLSDLEKKIKTAITTRAKVRKVKVSVESVLEYSGYSFAKNDPLIILFEKASKRLGIKPSFKSSGGGSDTNILNANGIRALNLSVGMSKVHTTEEFLEKKNLIRCAEMILSIIESE